jgi:tape measure domain-containing protein
MATTVGQIQYDVRLNLNQLKGDTKQAEKIVGSSNKNIESSSDKTGSKVSGMFGTIATAAKVAGAAAVAAFGSFSYFGLKTAGDLQATEKGFITLLGNAEDAARIMARIKEEAKRTPFEIQGLSTATQLLTSVTKDGDKAIDFLLDVGESLAAMGKGQNELDRIIVNLQQIGAVGKASMLDVKQFAFAGIPIFEMLQETTGKTGEALEDMISNGEVTFELLNKMFKNATDEGGRFAGAFKNQAGTFNQSVSNMKDTYMIFASDFVRRTGIFDGAVKVISGFSTILSDNQEEIYKTVDAIIEFGKKVIDVGRQVGEYLSPKLGALWRTISDDLLPVLYDFWKSYLEPLIPVIGTVLVGAIGASIDQINLWINIFSKFLGLLLYS